MKVVLTEPVEIALRTLGEEDRRRVLAWLDHLKNWENDPFVREHSHKLESGEDVHVFKTSTDVWIFFTLRQDRITVLDIAKSATLSMFGQTTGAREP